MKSTSSRFSVAALLFVMLISLVAFCSPVEALESNPAEISVNCNDHGYKASNEGYYRYSGFMNCHGGRAALSYTSLFTENRYRDTAVFVRVVSLWRDQNQQLRRQVHYYDGSNDHGFRVKPGETFRLNVNLVPRRTYYVSWGVDYTSAYIAGGKPKPMTLVRKVIGVHP